MKIYNKIFKINNIKNFVAYIGAWCFLYFGSLVICNAYQKEYSENILDFLFGCAIATILFMTDHIMNLNKKIEESKNEFKEN